MKVLLIEDDPVCVKQLQYILKDRGIIHSAMTAKEAVAAFEHALQTKQPYNFVTLDIFLPDKDGFDVLLEIRDLEKKYSYALATNYKAVICMLTSSKDLDHYLASVIEECDGYFVKPISSWKMLNFLDKHSLE
ncbi:MAG: response regulator [Candidatus Margulisbacteria bacterium]|nr:response regulator [Candidatus Margulisiibacteriota bacterium]